MRYVPLSLPKSKDFLSYGFDGVVSERINMVNYKSCVLVLMLFSTIAHILSSVTATAPSDAVLPSALASVAPSICNLYMRTL